MTESQPKRGTKALELWCKRIVEGYPNVEIVNMTTSWRDGLAFCALIHHFRPDLIDFEKLDKKDILTNNDLAFRTAEKHFGIPALLEASDMLNYEVPDRLSILTYLSQYHRVFRNQEIPSSDINKINKLNGTKKITSTLKSTSSSSSSSFARTSQPPSSVLFGGGQSTLKREPCVKCNLPVFLAERILYKNSLYHNSCFTCVTCATQLIPSDLNKITELSANILKCQSCVDKEQGMLLFDDFYDGQETDTDAIKPYNSNGEHYNQENNDEVISTDLNSDADSINHLLKQSLSDEEKRKSVKGYYTKEKNGLLPNGIHHDSNIVVDVDDDDDDQGDDIRRTTTAITTTTNPTTATTSTATTSNTPINTSKLREHQNLSLRFATQMLLDHTNNNNNNTSNDKIDSSTNDNNKDVDIDDVDNDEEDNISSSNNENDVVNYISSVKSNEDKIIVDSNNLDSNDRDIKTTEQNCDQLTCINNNNTDNDKDKDNINDNDNTENENTNIEIINDGNDDENNKQKLNDNVDIIITGITVDESETDVDAKADQLDTTPIDIPILNNESIIVPSLINEHNKIILPDDQPQPQPQPQEEIREENKKPIIEVVVSSDDQRYPKELNPFGDDDEEVEDGYERNESSDYKTVVKPTPKPRVSTNPFEDDEDDIEQNNLITPISRTPVPAPRKSLAIQNRSPFGSNASLNSIARHRKGKAPLPPPMAAAVASPRQSTMSTNPFATSDDALSIPSTSSQPTTPKLRKKRPAPTPPTVTPIKNSDTATTNIAPSTLIIESTEPINLESSTTNSSNQDAIPVNSTPEINQSNSFTRRLIPLDISLIAKEGDSINPESEERIIIEGDITNSDYKRKLIVDKLDMTDDDDSILITSSLSERQLEKMKDNKEAKNRNRKSAELSMAAAANIGVQNQNDNPNTKVWRHTKGPAPPLPVCRYIVKHELSNQEINHELEVIKVQQNGLEKQGVILEKMIRSRSEGVSEIESEPDNNDSLDNSISSTDTDVDDLIMQLFEIVNEKNELFRRQAELLNLRRQYRLEQEQSELEYKIRLSMAQPERNKTDSDKEKEDALIARLVQVVQQRNEVVECFEMDRLREIEEDLSIKQSLEMHTAKRDTKLLTQSPGSTLTKLSKKEKKKLKAFKLVGHSKKNKIDADKDEDETEINNVPPKHKKHKFIKFPLIK